MWPADEELVTSAAKASSIARDQRLVQRKLTQGLCDSLRVTELAAAHSSGSSPVFLYDNDVEQVRVAEGHHWADLHHSHDMWRSDLTAFCRNCGSTSTTNRTSYLQG